MIPSSPATAALRRLLTETAAAGGTGALLVDGSPGGTLYLAEGRITHAESPACPGVGDRLVDSGRLAAATWQAAYDAGYAEQCVGRRLVDAGHLVQGELVCRVLASICDATHAILQSDPADVRFVPGVRHWLGVVTQIELTALTRETVRRQLLRTATVELPVVRPVPAPRHPEPGPAAGVPRNDRVAAVIGGPAGPAPDGPWAGRPRAGNAGPAAGDVVPIRRGDVRTTNAGPHPDGGNVRTVPDYATLKRIRRALMSIE